MRSSVFFACVCVYTRVSRTLDAKTFRLDLIPVRQKLDCLSECNVLTKTSVPSCFIIFLIGSNSFTVCVCVVVYSQKYLKLGNVTKS